MENKKETYYVTTAIDYPNGNPHIGHAFEKIISDIFARWNRSFGKEVFFSTGTDEHGQKIEKYAKEAHLSPKEFVDNKILVFQKLCRELSISNDVFIRTTDVHHEKFAQELFNQALKNKDIFLGEYEGNYCIYDETFFTDKDLLEGNKCPLCNRETQLIKEPAYFFPLGKYQERLIKYIEENDFIRPITRRNEILSRLKNQDLRDLCVSRTTFSWGIPLLNDKSHIIYVWFDALINYLTAIKYPEGENAHFWPANVHVIGKDIIWFHTVIWPAMLMALNIPLPKKVYAHGFILAKGGEKMSKSKGNVLDPFDLIKKFGEDGIRYYLAKMVPSADDGFISEEDIINKINSELANDLGNVVMRCVKLSLKRIGNTVCAPVNYSNIYSEKISHVLSDSTVHIDNCEYDKALEKVWSLVKILNAYMNEKEPWKVTNDQEFHLIMYTSLDVLCQITSLLEPFIPSTANKIFTQLGERCTFLDLHKVKEFTLIDSGALFPKIEVDTKDGSLNKESTTTITQDSSNLHEKQILKLFPLHLRVAKIISVENHPNADKLLKIQVALNDEESEKRQILAGLKNYYSAEELVGKKIIIVSNLKPAKLRGELSEGMLLAGEHDGVVKILTVNTTSLGKTILPKGYSTTTDQISIDEVRKYPLLVNNQKVYFLENVLCSDVEDVFVELIEGNVY